ncbi:YL1 nuclear protein-domain-containing protein [Lentinula boryana]|uniref:YL1 nuclear protein-domain-containing protein n=1 Tax=Lentinula boryana TaxID=40481 RepID=A0ABQ8QEY1_9AGAR|nr:YL1 nuclear protein-domain-containing protein [Lentinula boryana]
MEEETLVSRRSKRSTAGNRMQAALAEIAVEDLSKEDAEEDKDFVVETYEEDAFESDFESTDEEAVAAAEQEPAENEEKQARKDARSRFERTAAAAHARQKITFNPTATSEGAAPSTPKTKPKRKPRVSLGFAINAETGEVIAENDEDKDGHNSESEAEEGTVRTRTKRSSKRQTTIQNTTDTVKRYLKSEQQKALHPSRKRSGNNRRPTQSELLARALDTEEGNLVDHRDYLKNEEEKRQMRNKRDQVTVSGPLLRWVSRAEEFKVEVVEEKEKEERPPGATPEYVYNPYLYTLHSASAYTSQPSLPASTSSVESSSTSMALKNWALRTPSTSTTPISTSAPYSTPYPYPTQYNPSPTLILDPTLSVDSNTLQNSMSSHPPAGTAAPSSTSKNLPISHPTPTSTATISQNLQYPQYPNPYGYHISSTPALIPTSTSNPGSGLVPSSSPTTSTLLSIPTPTPTPGSNQPQPKNQNFKTEKVARSYLVHELSQDDEDNPKPSWEETMEAMFGNHVKWGEIKVYSTKNRPLSRYIPTCPITGLPAKYLDPRTGVPFANIRAYKTLQRLRKELSVSSESSGSEDDIAIDKDEGQVDVWDEDLGCYIGAFEGKFGDELEAETRNESDMIIDLT